MPKQSKTRRGFPWRGALGVELSLWCGFGLDRSFSHCYARAGIVTLYACRFHLRLFLAAWKRAAQELKRRARET